MGALKKAIAPFVSLLLLGLFILGMGKHPFFPSFRLLADTSWDLSLFQALAPPKFLSCLWMVPALLGFAGWSGVLRKTVTGKWDEGNIPWLGLSIAVSLFSIYVFALGINGILVRPLAAMFFLPLLVSGRSIKTWRIPRPDLPIWTAGLLGLSLFLWAFEYLSPPLIWDAVLDHFHYAKEVSRLGRIPFHWTNHTGDMPKSAELFLAGFWTLGGEPLAKLSSALPALLTAGILALFSRERNGKTWVPVLIFFTCPFFLALFAWGYAEGTLALFEILALYAIWKGVSSPQKKRWLYLCAYSLGVSLSIKYTAALAVIPCLFLWAWSNRSDRSWRDLDWRTAVLFLVPVLPWLLKNEYANGDPFYPLATSLFGGPPGFSTGMENDLWKDTGTPGGEGLLARFHLLWKVFFTPSNFVDAAWTPLAVMCLPWMGKVLRTSLGRFLALFALFFFTEWFLFCTNLRHAAVGTLALVLLSAMAWGRAMEDHPKIVPAVLAAGTVLGLWLTLSAQLTTTAPYASALGLEDPLLRLRRNYYFNLDTFAAYRAIEKNSEPCDKVMAFGVFETYPLRRTSFVDFKWKKPVFLSWAASSVTAERLAGKLREEGVVYFLYRQGEAVAMSAMEKDFRVEGIPPGEYLRFWSCFMEPVGEYENTWVYRVRDKPVQVPWKLAQLPGVQEPWLRNAGSRDVKKAYGSARDLTDKYPGLASGWTRRSVLERGDCAAAFRSGLNAARLGASNLELCDTMVRCAGELDLTSGEKEWALFRDKRKKALDLAVGDALAYYRSGDR